MVPSRAPQLHLHQMRAPAPGFGDRWRLAWAPEAKPEQDVRHFGIDYRQRIAVAVKGRAPIVENLPIAVIRSQSADRDPIGIGQVFSWLGADHRSAQWT